MKFAVIHNGHNAVRDAIAADLIHTCQRHGHVLHNDPYNAHFVLNLTSIDEPQYFKRRSKNVFLISIVAADAMQSNLRSVCYTTLIRTFSNMVICAQQNGAEDRIHASFTTPEAGFYDCEHDRENVYDLMMPVAGAHFAAENVFSCDLPDTYSTPSATVRQLIHYAKHTDELGVLPTPFPLRELLCQDDLDYLYRVFGISGVSYGNLSAREDIPGLAAPTFWMTGRGVNKSRLSVVGKDILLVKDFNFDTGTAFISQPQGYDPRARVSIDAVEHALIYKTFPQTGAIVHLHAWMDGVRCTHQNHPCGTIELAQEVVDLLGQTPDPAFAVVGLKNHGLTITGRTLDEIFERIESQLQTEIPMFH